MTINKAAAARAAKAAGLKTFTAHCKRHGETTHNSSGAQCVACKAAQYAQTVATPEAREALNEYWRARFVTSSNRRGKIRENTAAKDYCRVTGGNLPASYASEREPLQAIYAAVPEDHQADHLTPKIAKDFRGTHVASGLHTVTNIKAIPRCLNIRKRSYFDPDNFREQRPANAFPGGQWDSELTEQEWSRVELLVRHYGADRDTTVRAIQAQITRQHAGAHA
jgi:hypothetical protein